MPITFLSPLLTATAVAGVLLLLIYRLLQARHKDNIPPFSSLAEFHTAGFGPGLFQRVHALVISVYSLRNKTYDGYIKHTKQNRPFLLANIMTGSANLVLPPSLLHLVNQPDRGFLAFNAFSDKFQFRYMINDPDVWHNVLQFEVIRRKFSRQERIVPLASYTAEELQFAFHGVWGDDLQWSDLNGCDTSGRIIARMALRIMVGLPLGRPRWSAARNV